MIPQNTDDAPARQVNHILQNLRGEQFRHARNVQGKPASSSSLSSHAHNKPTLPYNLIYPTPETSRSWVPGPSPPRSWQSPTATVDSESEMSRVTDTPAWRERALSLLFSPSSCDARPSPVPRLTLLCLQLIRATCPGTDLADVVPFIPPHLRRTLVRHAAIHAPLSQIELDTLRGGSTHIDTELIVVGPRNTLRARTFRRNSSPVRSERTDDDSGTASKASWDADHAQEHDGELLALRSLAVLSSPLSAATILAFPPTITHLALIDIPHRIPLPRLPTICPLVVLLDLSYNTWLRGESLMLEGVEWRKLQRLEVLGLRECPVTPKLLLELNRGRWEAVRIIQ